MTNETAPEQEDDYWIVSMEVFAFYSAEEAKEYTDRLADAFTAMPESEEYAASVKYYHASDDALEAAQARIAELEQHIADMIDDSGQECACGYDNPTDICLGHLPMYRKTQARIAELEGALTRIDEASNHYAMTPTYSEGTLRYAHKSTRNLARAALEGKGCS